MLGNTNPEILHQLICRSLSVMAKYTKLHLKYSVKKCSQIDPQFFDSVS